MSNWMGTARPRWARVGVALAVLTLGGCGALLTPQYRIHRAEREMKAGEWQKAAVDLRAVVQKQPRNTHAWLLLSHLALLAGDANGAAASLEHAIGAGARGPKVNLLQARVWLATGKAKTLLAALHQRTLTLTEPDRSVLKAKAQIQIGKTDEAIATLKPVLDTHPKLTAARDTLAGALLQQGKFDEAIAQLRQAAAFDPKSPEPRVLEGRIDQWRGQFARAEHALEGGIKLMPPAEPVLHRVSALVALTESRLALGQTPAAAKSQAALAALEPTAPETVLLGARIKLIRHDLDGAIDDLERVVASAPKFAQARMVLGAALLQRGDLEQAQQQLQRVVQLTPENIQARKLLAAVQLKLGQPQSALEVLNPTLSSPALDPQLLKLYGAAARKSGNSQALAQALERIVRTHPNDQAAKLNLASVYLAGGRAPQALALLQKTPDTGDLRRDHLLIVALDAVRGPSAAGAEVGRLLAAHPKDPGVLTLGAGYYVSRGHFKRARTLLKRSLALNPNDAGSLIGLARIEEMMGHSDAAERRLQAALDAHPKALPIRLALAGVLVHERQFPQARSVLEAAGKHGGPDVSFALARVALAQGDLKAANAALDQATAAQPTNAAIVEGAGLILLQANHYSAALARFSKATQLTPNNAAYWFNSARAQLALNQPLAARASLQKAEKIEPNWLPAVSALALLDVRQGKTQAALDRTAALVKREPRDPGALALKGQVEAAAGHYKQAFADLGAAQRLHPTAAVAVQLFRAKLAAKAPHPEQDLQQWLSRHPKDWQVRGVLADYEMTYRHALRQAIEQYRNVISVNPNDAVALNNLAWAMGRVGDPGAARIAQRAYRLAPKSSSVADTLGWILARRGRSAEALKYLEQSTRHDPKNPTMQYHYAYALAKTGRKDQARTILTKILSGSTAFGARKDAERLLAALKRT